MAGNSRYDLTMEDETMDNEIFLLTNRTDADLLDRIKALSARIELVSSQQLEADPELLAKVEIVYGHISRQNVAKAAGLRWVQITGAGVNNWITPEIAESSLVVTNVSGIHARSITEHMFGLLLGQTRALGEAGEGQRRREWRHLGAKVESLYGKTLGILGMGAIGEQTARVGRAFEMQVIGLRRSGKPHAEVETMYSPETRLEFFARCHVVMNLLPLTEKTRGFMSDAELEALPGGAIIVNAGRGATIDTPALLRALHSGKVKAALLDVTDPEPLPADHVLWETPGVVITPHYSGAHPEYNAEADEIFLDNLRRYLNGEDLHHVVDKREGY